MARAVAQSRSARGRAAIDHVSAGRISCLNGSGFSAETATRRPRTSAHGSAFCFSPLIAIALILSGCASDPPLPKRVAMETDIGSMPAADFSASVAEADIIYFPAERAASGARTEPAGLLIDAFRNSGGPFTIGWGLIEEKEQPLLDQLGTQSPAAREKLVARLKLAGAGRAREHCRSVLNDPRLASVPQLALKLSEPAGAGAIEGEVEPRPGMHFRQPPAALETFAERMTAAESLSGGDVTAAYQAHVAEQQFAAEQIIRHFEGGKGGKLLAFLPAADLESGRGVPFYVAQKLSLRQLVLGPSGEYSSARKLLTGRWRADWSGREIVDRSPASARY